MLAQRLGLGLRLYAHLAVKAVAQKLVESRRIGRLNVGQTLAAERSAANRATEHAAEQNFAAAHFDADGSQPRFTIADVSMLGWVRNLIGFYEAGDLVDFKSIGAVGAWLDRGLARPAVQRGLTIP